MTAPERADMRIREAWRRIDYAPALDDMALWAVERLELLEQARISDQRKARAARAIAIRLRDAWRPR